jgi:hypothetical protein
MSKTIKEWFDSIQDPEIRNKASRNLNNGVADLQVSSIKDAISSGINWESSKEGYDFWNTIHNQNIKLLKIITPEEFYNDTINPDHYKNAIETIDAIEASMTPEAFKGYLKGNVIKYVTRYEKKNGLEDLKKADWYLSKLINTFANE